MSFRIEHLPKNNAGQVIRGFRPKRRMKLEDFSSPMPLREGLTLEKAAEKLSNVWHEKTDGPKKSDLPKMGITKSGIDLPALRKSLISKDYYKDQSIKEAVGSLRWLSDSEEIREQIPSLERLLLTHIGKPLSLEFMAEIISQSEHRSPVKDDIAIGEYLSKIIISRLGPENKVLEFNIFWAMQNLEEPGERKLLFNRYSEWYFNEDEPTSEDSASNVKFKSFRRKANFLINSAQRTNPISIEHQIDFILRYVPEEFIDYRDDIVMHLIQGNYYR